MRNPRQRASAIRRAHNRYVEGPELETALVLLHIEDKAFGQKDIHPCARAELIRLMREIKRGEHRS